MVTTAACSFSMYAVSKGTVTFTITANDFATPGVPGFVIAPIVHVPGVPATVAETTVALLDVARPLIVVLPSVAPP